MRRGNVILASADRSQATGANGKTIGQRTEGTDFTDGHDAERLRRWSVLAILIAGQRLQCRGSVEFGLAFQPHLRQIDARFAFVRRIVTNPK